jgi:murein DD-endopeptidase MepM/ murein hydrolase activator NlpD
MKPVRWALLTILLTAAACGSHNSAPVVYGTDPARQTRVYRSPDDVRRAQQAQQQHARTAQAGAYQKPVFQARTAAVEPVELTPVSAVYLGEPARRSAPQTLTPVRTAAAAPPAHLHKAKGYIEVQRGDTVYAVARKFNVTPAAIIDANDLKKPYALQVGQVLKLPSGAAALTVDAPSHAPAPSQVVVAKDRLYTVRAGDTLYSISRASGVPVGNIASANRLRAPYTLAVGQQVLLPQAPTGAKPALVAQRNPQPRAVADAPPPANMAEIARNASYTPPPAAVSPASLFSWPVRGAVISEYGSGNLGRRNDGVNIAAPVGTPVRAAADGQVVYRGSELEGFGNLLLLKHQDGFVTAYAHNDTMLVKKGDQVRKGQVIAKVGATGAVTTPQLHFEIRQESQAVDPVALLGKP